MGSYVYGLGRTSSFSATLTGTFSWSKRAKLTDPEASMAELEKVYFDDLAASWRTNESLQMYGSNLVFIDFEDRNIIRRIDLSDSRTDSLVMPDFLGNISIPPGKNIVYCLSKLTSTLYRVFIDISLLVLMDNKKITDCEGRG